MAILLWILVLIVVAELNTFSVVFCWMDASLEIRFAFDFLLLHSLRLAVRSRESQNKSLLDTWYRPYPNAL